MSIYPDTDDALYVLLTATMQNATFTNGFPSFIKIKRHEPNRICFRQRKKDKAWRISRERQLLLVVQHGDDPRAEGTVEPYVVTSVVENQFFGFLKLFDLSHGLESFQDLSKRLDLHDSESRSSKNRLLSCSLTRLLFHPFCVIEGWVLERLTGLGRDTSNS